MKRSRIFSRGGATLLVVVVLSVAGLGAADTDNVVGLTAADDIVSSLSDVKLRLLLEEVLERNPGLARLRAQADAADQRVPQVKAWPDPVASLTFFVLPPQTRAGPQRAALNLAQRFPWFGTLEIREKAALWEAAAGRAKVEAARLRIVAETRKAYHELIFLEAQRGIVEEDQVTLEHYGELALARYASGVGLGQAVVKIQAEITRTETRLLGIAARRAAVAAEVNALRDRPQSTPVLVGEVGTAPAEELDADELNRRAVGRRPEIVVAEARVEAAAARVELAQKASSPGVILGLNYGYVSRRDDAAGRENPPENNGDDILGLTGGISLPLWSKKLSAGVEEGVLTRLAAEEGRREATAEIEGVLGALLHRIPLLREQLRLFDQVLLIQAAESLRSAESAYAAGTAGALDLLDAERVLLQARIAAERARADLSILFAELEGVVAGPVTAGQKEIDR